MGLRVEERIANAICKNPRIMKAGITLEFKEVITKVSFGITIGKLTTWHKVSKHMIANMDKLRTNRLKVKLILWSWQNSLKEGGGSAVLSIPNICKLSHPFSGHL